MRPRSILITIISFFGLGLSAQDPLFHKEDLQNFGADICTCLESKANDYSNVEQLLFEGYNTCAEQYLLNHQDVLTEWVQQQHKMPLADSTQQFATDEAISSFLQQGNPVLVKTCSFYREQFQQFKTLFFQQLIGTEGGKQDDIQSAIDELEEILPNIPDPENLVMAHNLLGILYEFKGDIPTAREHYQASVDLGVGNAPLAAVFLMLLNGK